jgi:ribA/ribD-fused uncharacterized protein
MTKPGEMNVINRFIGEYAFLSNFYHAKASYENVWYPTSEHAYQASKTINSKERRAIRLAKTPGEAKRLGRRVMLRFGFETMKIDIMLQILRTKFSDPELKKRLLATKPFELVEGNTWGDRFWGQVNGVGQNWLGKCLMRLRSELENP